MDDLAALCDRVLVLNEGRTFEVGTPGDVFLRAGELNGIGLGVPAAQRVANALRERGLPLPAGVLFDSASLAATLTGLAGGTAPARFGGAGGSTMNAFSFGSYYPGESPLHRLDPRAKLLLGCAFIVVALCARNVAALGAVAVFVAAFYLASRIPLGYAARSLAPLLFIVVVASLLNLFVNQEGAVLVEWAFIRITAGGVGACLFIAARLVLILLGMSLITMTTPTLDLTEALEKLLSPFARFGLPAHELGMIMGIALRFLPQFATELVTGLPRADQPRRRPLDAQVPCAAMRMLSSLHDPAVHERVPPCGNAVGRPWTPAATTAARAGPACTR